MTNRRTGPALIVTALLLSAAAAGAARPGAELPTRVQDAAFWQLTSTLSEPDGSFKSDNLVSNELVFADVVPRLLEHVSAGGVYIGVGPEQNFTYIAATRPGLAFILDVRRDNLRLHLLYKALFELSTDRADFVARLFLRAPLVGVPPVATAAELMTALEAAAPLHEPDVERQVARLLAHLTSTRGFALEPGDAQGIEFIHRAFHAYGPAINWSTTMNGVTGGLKTFARLATQTDPAGRELGFLGSDARFAFVRDLHRRNLIVPVVGDFAGPRALRAIGELVRGYDRHVSTFYVSNVESYLHRDGTWRAFCANAASLPHDDDAVVIRPSSARVVSLGPVLPIPPGAPTGPGRSPWRLITPGGIRFPSARVVQMAPQFAACRESSLSAPAHPSR
jgi:hypothetical protein